MFASVRLGAELTLCTMCAGELPLELVCQALERAAGLTPECYGRLDWRSLKLLCAARAVSRQFRAGVDRVLEGRVELQLNEGDHLPAGLLTSPQARRMRNLMVFTSDAAEEQALSRTPAFRTFIEQSSRLRIATVYAHSATAAAFIESALCSRPSVVHYHAHGFVPRQLPLQLATTSVHPGPMFSEDALEAFLIHTQHCTALHLIALYLCLEADDEPVFANLRASRLSGLRFPALETMILQLDAFESDTVDFSWLARPRPFAVSLRLRDETLSDPAERLAVLRVLSGLLQPTDSLIVQLDEDSDPFSPAEQLALAELELAEFELTSPATRICHLPLAPSQMLSFIGEAVLMAELEWAAVSQQPGSFLVQMGDVQLQVLGCTGAVPAFDDGWQLEITTRCTVSGLPSALVEADSSERTYKL